MWSKSKEASMRKFMAIACVPLFASFLCAQQEHKETQTTVTKTTWNGTLVDADGRATTTERKETSTNPDQSVTHRTETRTVTECPVTTTTTTFGLLTSDGKYVRFDPAGNTKIVEIVKGNKKWN